MSSRTFRGIALLCLTPVLDAAPAALSLLSTSVVDTKALYAPTGAPYGRAFNGAGFQNDILVSLNGWQYTAWYDTVGDVQSVLIARRSVLGTKTGPWERVATDSKLVNGDEPSWDVHNTISLGVSPHDGTLHLSWDHHGNTLRYRRSVPGVATTETGRWGPDMFLPEQDSLGGGRGRLGGVTYPQFIHGPGDSLWFGYRTGGSTGGRNWLARYRPETQDYEEPILVTDSGGTYTGLSQKQEGRFTSTSRNAYGNGFDFGPDGSLHHTWTFRESGDDANHDLCYAYSTDQGRTWRVNDRSLAADTSKGQALDVETPGIVVVPLDGRQSLINQQAQTVDDQGRVHVVAYHRRDEKGYEWRRGDSTFFSTDTAYFHYVREPSTGQWRRARLPLTHPVGSRPDIETNATGDIFAVYESEGVLVVAGATAASRYADWSILATHGKNYDSEPRLDHARLRRSGVVSVLIQEGAGESRRPTPTALHVVEFAGADVFEVSVGPDQAVVDKDGDGFASVSVKASLSAAPGIQPASHTWRRDGQTVSHGANAPLYLKLPVGVHEISYEARTLDGRAAVDSARVTVLARPEAKAEPPPTTALAAVAAPLEAAQEPAVGEARTMRAYVRDASTLHLWHFDEPGPPFADSITHEHALRGAPNGAEAGKPSLPGLGYAVRVFTGEGNQRGAITYAPSLRDDDKPDTPTSFVYHGADGAFTFEALVKFERLPGELSAPAEILSMDGESAAERIFQFRLQPEGGRPRLRFSSLVTGGESEFSTELPRSGPNAPNLRDWFHVAVTYDGRENAPGSLKLYWTRVAPGVTEAARLPGEGRLRADFDHTRHQGDFAVGNEARAFGGASEVFPGLIDEVRLSSVARAPGDFILAR